MGITSPQKAAKWLEAAAVGADVSTRLAFTVLIAAGGALIANGAWPGVWLVISVATQIAALLVGAPLRSDVQAQVSPARRRAVFASAVLSAAVFAASGPLLWFDGGSGGRLFAVIVLAGGMINAAMQAGDSPRMLWAVCAPFMIALLTLPIVSMTSANGAERQVAELTLLAIALIVVHLGLAGHRHVEASRQLKRALQDAERERERAEGASRAKSDFLGVMSHELRTPLNGVLGMAQAMSGEPLSPLQRARLDVIHRSGENLLLLLNDLLDISEIDTARLEMAAGLVEVATLAAQTQTLFRPLTAGKALELRMEVLPSAGAVRTGDPLRVRQVLHNLVGNAVKFTEAGEVFVRIFGDDQELVFEVADTGPGLAPDQLDTLFQRFTQHDASSTRRYGGSGLGLAIARGLAQLMGGDVTVRSAPGEGAVFTARLRLPHAELPLGVAAPAEPQPAAHPLRVLAAEDNPTNQLVLKTLLEQVGVDVHLVADGQAAVDTWRDGRWDLVLMDVQMPIMDGLAATREIRAIETAERRLRTPIVAVTANACAERAAEYEEAGLDGLVPKPIQLGQLLAGMERALDRAGQELTARTAA
jgi:signal transduction histidine kinase/AmiR/NasT family two-component response regulator